MMIFEASVVCVERILGVPSYRQIFWIFGRLNRKSRQSAKKVSKICESVIHRGAKHLLSTT